MEILEKKRVDGMVCGMFKNKSYFGKKSSVLKSGVCKYFRREEFDKYEWCVIEMFIFGLKNKGLMTNIENRLKILIFEEIIVGEMNKVLKLIEIINELKNISDWEKKVSKVLNFIEISKNCKRGRICSYVNAWWKNHIVIYNYEKIKLNKVNKFKQEKDSERLLKLGELLIKFIDKRSFKMVDIFNKMFYIKKCGRRYKRNDGIYLFWQIIEDKFKNNKKFINIINYSRVSFYKKNLIERRYYGIWIILFIINYEKIEWNEEYNYNNINFNLNNYFKNRINIKIDEYVINDYHVNKKHGLYKFAIEGAKVNNENFENLEFAEKYKNFYIKMKKKENK
jgi:hypothetical protein